MIEVVRKSVFALNDRAAENNRALLAEHGTVAVNIMGGDGCGKTALLECVLPLLRRQVRAGVIEGDIATTRDAERIAACGVPVVQILTEGGCHLTATLVEQGLRRLPLGELDVVLIENVGNPVCPANFDLGEQARVSVLSVTEGDDKPAKYPHLFQVADRVVISKTDLLGATDFDLERATREIKILNEGATIDRVTRKDPASAGSFADWLVGLADPLRVGSLRQPR
ncbi:MAG: hydrogenase nickel incorporation protein HypB [Phycisphaerae bacterium]|nr:hydrogenase nickel incorporation protein HypB [Phycisphaerae bacterium]